MYHRELGIPFINGGESYCYVSSTKLGDLGGELVIPLRYKSKVGLLNSMPPLGGAMNGLSVNQGEWTSPFLTGFEK